MSDSIETSEREAEEPRGPITLPVREMRDEPLPHQAADPLRAALQLALEATPEQLPAALRALAAVPALAAIAAHQARQAVPLTEADALVIADRHGRRWSGPDEEGISFEKSDFFHFLTDFLLAAAPTPEADQPDTSRLLLLNALRVIEASEGHARGDIGASDAALCIREHLGMPKATQPGITSVLLDVANTRADALTANTMAASARMEATQPERTPLEQYDLDQSPEYRKGYEDGRLKGFEVGQRYAREQATQPTQAEAPSDGELNALANAHTRWNGSHALTDYPAFARAVLERWGRAALSQRGGDR